jgi:hypothetical protein
MRDDIRYGFGYKLGSIVRAHPRKIIFGLVIFSAVVVANYFYKGWVKDQYSKEVKQAKEAGFSSVAEMKSMAALGFESKSAFNDAEAKKIGFENYSEMKKYVAEGINSGKELAEATAKARAMGFGSYDAMKAYNAQVQALKDEEEKKLRAENEAAEAKDRAERREWESRCQRYATARSECAVAERVSRCVEIKIGEFDSEMSKVYCDGSRPNWFLMGKR